MGDKTKIEWADSSCSPLRARNRKTNAIGWYCSHASPGCLNCYSEGINRRLGTGVPYRAQDSDLVEVFLDERIMNQPLRWRRPRRIFWNSMSDTFGERGTRLAEPPAEMPAEDVRAIEETTNTIVETLVALPVNVGMNALLSSNITLGAATEDPFDAWKKMQEEMDKLLPIALKAHCKGNA